MLNKDGCAFNLAYVLCRWVGPSSPGACHVSTGGGSGWDFWHFVHTGHCHDPALSLQAAVLERIGAATETVRGGLGGGELVGGAAAGGGLRCGEGAGGGGGEGEATVREGGDELVGGAAAGGELVGCAATGGGL